MNRAEMQAKSEQMKTVIMSRWAKLNEEAIAWFDGQHHAWDRMNHGRYRRAAREPENAIRAFENDINRRGAVE
jgi:hypothetical protein